MQESKQEVTKVVSLEKMSENLPSVSSFLNPSHAKHVMPCLSKH